jgi:hypothetical protein
MGQQQLFSLIRNVAHKNLSGLFGEEKKLLPDEHSLTVTQGVVGSYPNAFFFVEQAKLSEFVDAVKAIQTEADYQRLLDNYAVRRTDRDFWRFSDELHAVYREGFPEEAGLLDYNRVENR